MKKILQLTLLVLSISLPLTNYAQLFSSKQTIDTSTGNNPFSIETGDLDNDNYPDILIGTLGNTIEWYKNNQNNTFTKQTNISSTLSYVKGLAIADLDNDNDNDVIAISNLSNKLVWYQNDGNGNFSSEIIISSTLDRPVAIKVGKINNDNFNDVAVVEYDGNRAVWFANNGSGSFGTANIISSPAVITKPRSIDLNDYDNDGDLDAVIAYYQTKYVLVHLNDLNQTNNVDFSQYEIVVQGVTDLRNVSFKDVNNDNQLDVLVVASSTNLINWYESNGSGGFISHVISPTNTNPNFALVGDIDSDSMNDIVVSYANSSDTNDEISWFESTGSGSFSTESIIDNSQDDVTFSMIDFDNDGDLDLASISTNQNSLSWFENYTNDSSLSINNNDFAQVKIYPNPANEYIAFKNLSFDNLSTISIYNVLGKQVISTQISTNEPTIDISGLKKGIYIAQLKIDTHTNKTIKFIKK